MNNEKAFELAVLMAIPQLADRPTLDRAGRLAFIAECYSLVKEAAKVL